MHFVSLALMLTSAFAMPAAPLPDSLRPGIGAGYGGTAGLSASDIYSPPIASLTQAKLDWTWLPRACTRSGKRMVC
jgi:hypothetical protein